MLYLCLWEESDDAFLVDANSESEARSIAKTEDGTDTPSSVKPLPSNFFAVWLRLGDVDRDDPEEYVDALVLEPLEHVDNVLCDLAGFTEDDEENEAGACGATGELDDGEVVVCTEPLDHEPPHRVRAGGTVTAEWEDA
jgi:hypothetical protein